MPNETLPSAAVKEIAFIVAHLDYLLRLDVPRLSQVMCVQHMLRNLVSILQDDLHLRDGIDVPYGDATHALLRGWEASLAATRALMVHAMEVLLPTLHTLAEEPVADAVEEDDDNAC